MPLTIKYNQNHDKSGRFAKNPSGPTNPEFSRDQEALANAEKYKDAADSHINASGLSNGLGRSVAEVGALVLKDYPDSERLAKKVFENDKLAQRMMEEGRANDVEIDSFVKVALFRAFFSWSMSSRQGDENTKLQDAVAREFGGRAEWHNHLQDKVEQQRRRGQEYSDDAMVLANLRNQMPEERELYSNIAKSIYKHSQEQLERLGIEKMMVWRGKLDTEYKYDPGDTSDSKDNQSWRALSGGPQDTTVKPTRPLSSWSASMFTASGFTNPVEVNSDTYNHGYLVGMIVPRKDIFSTCLSGYGSGFESEVVVLGGNKTYNAAVNHHKSLRHETQEGYVQIYDEDKFFTYHEENKAKKQKSLVVKYNQNHDKAGRFAKNPGGAAASEQDTQQKPYNDPKVFKQSSKLLDDFMNDMDRENNSDIIRESYAQTAEAVRKIMPHADAVAERLYRESSGITWNYTMSRYPDAIAYAIGMASDQWACASREGDYNILLQRSVERVFNLGDDWRKKLEQNLKIDPGDEKSIGYFDRRDTKNEAEAALATLSRYENDKEVADLFDAIAKVRYQETQDYLKHLNISEVYVWRGKNRKELTGVQQSYVSDNDTDWNEKPDGTPVRRQIVSQKPLTSWSISRDQALSFIDPEHYDDRYRKTGYLLGAQVSAKDIFAMASTGQGTYEEAEVVLLGGKNKKYPGLVSYFEPPAYKGQHAHPAHNWTDEDILNMLDKKPSKKKSLLDELLIKFNPNHDKSGRFAKSPDKADNPPFTTDPKAYENSYAVIEEIQDQVAKNRQGGAIKIAMDAIEARILKDFPDTEELAKRVYKRDKLAQRQVQLDSVVMGKDGNKSMLREAIFRSISYWNASSRSGPENMWLQDAVAREIGTDTEWHKHLDDTLKRARKMDAENVRIASESVKYIKKQTPDQKELFTRIAKSIYNTTQDKLKDMGVERIIIWRGKKDSEDLSGDNVPRYQSRQSSEMRQLSGGPQPIEIKQSRPLSSWSASYVQAEDFSMNSSGSYSRGHEYMIGAVVPREHIFSFGLTGPGSPTEREVVLLGGTYHAAVNHVQHHNGKMENGSQRYRDASSFMSAFENSKALKKKGMILDELSIKFNPNHDKNGRFAKDPNGKASDTGDTHGAKNPDLSYDEKVYQDTENIKLDMLSLAGRGIGNMADNVKLTENIRARMEKMRPDIHELAEKTYNNIYLSDAKFDPPHDATDTLLRALSREWASSSRREMIVHLMSAAVATEFDNGADWKKKLQEQADRKISDDYKDYDAEQARYAAATTLQNITFPEFNPDYAKAFFQTAVRAMYENTQEYFKKAGIKEVYLWRGKTEREYYDKTTQNPYQSDTNAKFPKNGDLTPVEAELVSTKPVSSWSANLHNAAIFATPVAMSDYASHGYMMGARVPVENIFSTAITGLGVSSEHEMLVLGGSKYKLRGAANHLYKNASDVSFSNDTMYWTVGQFIDKYEQGKRIKADAKKSLLSELSIKYNQNHDKAGRFAKNPSGQDNSSDKASDTPHNPEFSFSEKDASNSLSVIRDCMTITNPKKTPTGMLEDSITYPLHAAAKLARSLPIEIQKLGREVMAEMPFESWNNQQEHESWEKENGVVTPMARMIARAFVQWNDGNEINSHTLLLQRAIAEEFGLGHSEWVNHMKSSLQGDAKGEMQLSGIYENQRKRDDLEKITNENGKLRPEIFDKALTFYRAVARKVYDQTQEYFAKKGITELTVWRGKRYWDNPERAYDRDPREYEGIGDTPRDQMLAQRRPISSWSADYDIAKDFTVSNPPGAMVKTQRDKTKVVGLLYGMRVNVKDIFATGIQGIGTTNEREVLVMGGDKKRYRAVVAGDVKNAYEADSYPNTAQYNKTQDEYVKLYHESKKPKHAQKSVSVQTDNVYTSIMLARNATLRRLLAQDNTHG